MTECRCHSHNGLRRVPPPPHLSLEGLELAGEVAKRYIDRVGSVSGLRRDETVFDDELLDQQYQRFLDEVYYGEKVT